MGEIVLSIASKVAEYLVAPVGRQCGYVIFSNSYVGELKEEVANLEDARVGVQRSVNDAQNNMKEIKREVVRWKNDAESVANNAHGVLENDEIAKKTCFCGWLPNPKERYCLGRDARKTVQAIQELIPQGKFERVYYESAPPGLVRVAPEGNSSAGGGGENIQEHIARGQSENAPPELVGGAADLNSSAADGGDIITGSRASIFHDIMEALGDDKLKVIGVYGPGGVGKTTLLKEVKEKLGEEKKPFQMIVKAEVSQTPDLDNIRNQIADYLQLDLRQKQSPQGRRDLLLERLQRDPNEKILIILDDLWKELDLEAVGIPNGDESRGCKLLLTSRYKDVLEQKMHADRTFRLEVLNSDEAFRLFEKKVGDKLKDEEELKDIATQLVEKLAGLPLLIISAASTLKYSNAPAWRNALIKIEESNVETIVKLAYDHLKSEDAKFLFLLCGLIGGTIQVETLLVLGMGLGLFEGFNKTMQDTRDRLDTTLEEVRSVCLLQDGGTDKENVAIHDLYSEVVVSTPFRGQNSLIIYDNCSTWPKEKLDECRACLVNVGKDRFVELMPHQFPQAKILMLSQPRNWYRMPEHQHDVSECSGLLDFTCMKQLRALYIRSMHIPTLASSIQILENLRSLYLDHCHVEDVAILGKLKALQILSFAGSTISKLPKEIGDLTNLKSLNLSNCWRLEIIEPGVLKGLINLEELLMRGSFHRWMGNDEVLSEPCNAKLAELKNSTKLTALEISIPDPTILLEDGDLPFGNLTRFSINIGGVIFGREFRGLRTMKLKLEGCDAILSKEWIQKTLHKTQHLHLDGLREFKKSAHELCIRGFPQLKHLDTDNNPSIEYIANSSNGLPLTAFTKLESLFLKNLINLEKIWNGLIAPDCFNKLKAVSIEKCHQLKSLGFLSEMQRLVHLEEIYVRECDSLQDIVTYEAGNVEAAHDYIVELPNVRRLNLLELPNMTSFCTGAEGGPIQVSLPSLEELRFDSVGSLKRIWHGELPKSSFCQLSTLTLDNCSGLLTVFPSTIIGRLHNLKSVQVSWCPSLESVFDCGSLDLSTEQTRALLPKLEGVFVFNCPSLQSLFDCGSLHLNAERTILLLPKLEEVDVKIAGSLRHVVKSDSRMVLGFPSLTNVSIKNCTELRYLFPYFTAATLKKLEKLEIRNCQQMKEVVPKEEGGRSKADVMIFPSLTEVTIQWCSDFQSFIPSPTSVGRKLGETAEENNESPQPLFNEMVSLPSLEELRFDSIGSLKRIWHGELPKSSFCQLATLALDNCSGLLTVFPSTIIGRLHNLERVRISKCPSLESVFDCSSLDLSTEQTRALLPKLEGVFVFNCPSLQSLFDCGSLHSNAERTILLLPKLEEVDVKEAASLRHVVKSDSQTVLGFPSLTNVSIKNCTELRYLFPYFTAATLKKLEKLKIRNCQQIKEVVPEEEGGRSKADVMSFPSLTEVTIQWCSDFQSFIPSPTSVGRKLGETAEENNESPQPLFNEMVELPNITFLQIQGTQCKELWNNQIPDHSFCKLEFLRLMHCDNLRCIAPSHVWKRLQCCLDILQVVSCRSIEIIYEGDDMVMKSGKLRRLILRDLKNLRHIWQSDGHPNVLLPSLRFIEVQNCPRLKMLFSTFTPDFLGQIKELWVESCEDMELIAGHEECEEATGTAITFSKLTALRLFKLPKFRSFLPEKYFAEFPSLQVLSRVSCGREPNHEDPSLFGLTTRWARYRESRKYKITEEIRKYKSLPYGSEEGGFLEWVISEIRGRPYIEI